LQTIGEIGSRFSTIDDQVTNNLFRFFEAFSRFTEEVVRPTVQNLIKIVEAISFNLVGFYDELESTLQKQRQIELVVNQVSSNFTPASIQPVIELKPNYKKKFNVSKQIKKLKDNNLFIGIASGYIVHKIAPMIDRGLSLTTDFIWSKSFLLLEIILSRISYLIN
jgi:hypothetical protein